MDVAKYAKNPEVARLLREAGRAALERDLALLALTKAEESYSAAHRAVILACEEIERLRAVREASDLRAEEVRKRWGRR